MRKTVLVQDTRQGCTPDTHALLWWFAETSLWHATGLRCKKRQPESGEDTP